MDNILVPYDFNRQSEYALEQALNLARQTKSKITLLYVNEYQGFLSSIFSDQQDEEMLEKINDHLDSVAARTSLRSGVDVEATMQKGRIYSVIIKTAEDIKARFIVMGSRSNEGDPDGKSMLGANTSRVIRSAPCPVITISKGNLYDGVRSILLPMDLTKETKQKVGWAIEFAKIYGAKIRAVSALWSLNDPEIISKLNMQMNQVKKFIEDAGITCEAEIIESPKGEKTHVPAILDYAKSKGDVDLIVIMTQQEFSIVEFFVGSHAQEFLRCSEVPVVSVIPKELGFASIMS
ncbi:MAG TPA: universal stress protein [Lentimicrobium sp.]|nr:universal stress protein [Lentimicrobium sp.]